MFKSTFGACHIFSSEHEKYFREHTKTWLISDDVWSNVIKKVKKISTDNLERQNVEIKWSPPGIIISPEIGWEEVLVFIFVLILPQLGAIRNNYQSRDRRQIEVLRQLELEENMMNRYKCIDTTQRRCLRRLMEGNIIFIRARYFIHL